MNPSAYTARLTQIVMWVVGLFLSFRFFLRLFNADATNRFVRWIYDVTFPAIKPFFSWFPPVRTADGFNPEFATVVALLVYTVVGFAIMAFVGSYRSNANSVAAQRTFKLEFKKPTAKTKAKPKTKKPKSKGRGRR